MALKIVAKSKRTPMLKIGEDVKSADWYFLKDNVKTYVYDKITQEDIKAGILVKEMKVEKKLGKKYISFLVIDKAEEKKELEEIAVEEMNLPELPQKKERQFSRPKAERKEIIAQAIGHMVSRVLAGMASQCETEELEDLIEILYSKFAEVVENYIIKQEE